MKNLDPTTYFLEGGELKQEINASLIGGKSFQLYYLKKLKLDVPTFLVVTSQSYQFFLKNAHFPLELKREVKEFFKQQKIQYVSVRSSMSKEDGPNKSYAGCMESFLYVDQESVFEKIEQCFLSMQSDRKNAYESFHAGKKSVQVQETHFGSVIVQVMLPSYASGVVFSRSPQGNSGVCLIESGFGLGEGIVSGLVDIDSFWVDRFSNLQKSEIRNKEKALVHLSQLEQLDFIDAQSQANLGPTRENLVFKPVKDSFYLVPSLNSDEIKQIAQHAFWVEERLGYPVDMEWAVCWDENLKQRKLYFLQVRPITLPLSPLYYFMDINLVESYPQTTSPLTGSFVENGYFSVFSECLSFLGFSKKRSSELKFYLKDLVRYIHGHLYYNLKSYYTVLMVFPGGVKNIENWHSMIGGKPFSKVIPPVSSASLFEKISIAYNLMRLIHHHDAIFDQYETKVLNFLEDEAHLVKYENSPKVLLSSFLKAPEKFRGMGLTALNDVLIMLGLGYLEKKINQSHLSSDSLALLLKTQEGVESLRPLWTLEKIVQQSSHLQKEILEVFEKHIDQSDFRYMPQEIYSNIFADLKKRRDLVAFTSQIESFLKEFGQRAFYELKLECLTYKQSPELFYDLLKWSYSKHNFSQKGLEQSSQEGLKKKEQIVSEIQKGLNPFEKMFFKWVLRKTEKAIAARERTRLLRGKIYSSLRDVFLKFVFLLRKANPYILGDLSLKHFFSADLNLLSAYLNGQINERHLKQDLIKNSFWIKQDIDYPTWYASSLSETDLENPYFLNSELEEHLETENVQTLNGIGASSGEISGYALVLSGPEEALLDTNLSQKILITKTTDPAWIFIMGQCKGLISEKGSLLSHTAIVGRELGIPTVVGVKNATQLIAQNQKIKLCGKTGRIELLNSSDELSETTEVKS